jgi:hypothetical protein
VRFLLLIVMLFAGAVPARAAPAAALERGTAVIDPAALRELDRGRFGISRMLSPDRSANIPLTDSELFALPSMAPVRRAIDGEFERYIAKHKATLPNETIGAGDGFDFHLFDRAMLDSPDTLFVLAGIVNRMDRTFVRGADCGEIRLIYRLMRTNAADGGADAVSPRLPMTLNLVLKTRVEGQDIACSEIARRWLAAGELSITGAELAQKLLAKDGPLGLVGSTNIDRIETNLQIAHASKSAMREFRTDYLLKVFRYDPHARVFAEAPMENQIDRDRILADDNLRHAFKAWLLDPKHLVELDRGTVLIPEHFLAHGAIAPTPAGFDPSDLQPEFGLLQGEGIAVRPVFGKADVVAALRKASADGVKLQNIRSVGGFERRLNDVTCSGCHQTRGIGGFHFPGVDWMAARPSNSTVVPASPHFFGDQVRRRNILIALRDGRTPDYSRGFSSRPQLRGSTELAGTEYDNGWGGHCYIRHSDAADNDPSFKSWNCAEGLACQTVGKASRIGMCFIGVR